ncbi:MAG: hypothetical protein QNJ75_04910 [Acidimicrobiia bacterium]|nr:hypothetical protein [Acidimicrobiia bacterium]
MAIGHHSRSFARSLRVRITLALIVVFATAACAFPEEGFDGDLEGDYYINGVDQKGNEYGGSLTIVATDEPDVYDMQWIITGSIQSGVGTVTDDLLVVEWGALEGFDTSSRGTATYEITPEGQLIGERTVAGEDGIGSEEAFPIR